MLSLIHRLGALAGILVLLGSQYPEVSAAADLRDETLEAWDNYVRLTEQRIDGELGSPERFLVEDFLPSSEADDCRRVVRSGKIFVERLRTVDEEGKKVRIPKGLVHHWFGSILIPRAELGDVLEFLQSYAEHDKYFDEVEESRLLAHRGPVYEVFFKLRRKKGITVHYNTEHVVTYLPPRPGRASSRSVATRIAELEDVDSDREREKPPGADRGFLWRLNSYWRFKQEPEGVIVECESISLSRTIPFALRWMVQPFIVSVPKESLETTLGSIRAALRGTAMAGN